VTDPLASSILFFCHQNNNRNAFEIIKLTYSLDIHSFPPLGSENASITAPDVDPEHDPATAILRKKAAPNKLIVDDATNDDNSVLALSTATMEKLQFFRGDMVLVKGKKRRDTVLIVLADDSVEDSKVRINKGKSQVCFSFFSYCFWICSDDGYGQGSDKEKREKG
jgi:hypothetical protein